MPNHIHAIIAFHNTGRSINKIIGNGKRFMAYEIVTRLEKKLEKDVLGVLTHGLSESERNKGKLHQVWEDSFDWKECRRISFLILKLDYMHNNPCSGK
jgi:hypothetical protein